MNIPQDWSKLSDEEAFKYMEYLRKHSYKYKITMDENKVIHMDDKVNIARGIKDKTSCVRINNKYFYAEFANRVTPYDRAYDFYRHLEHKLLPLKTKAKEWWDDYHDKVYALIGLVVVIGGMSFLITKLNDSYKREQEKFKQEIIKEALEQFKQEQRKTNSTIQYQMQNTK